MKFKLILFAVLLTFSLSGMAQGRTSFFSPIKKLNKTQVVGVIPGVSSSTTFWALRPKVTATTIFTGGTTKLAAGAGFAYQNITQNAEGENYVNYDFALIALAGGSVIPDRPTDIGSLGLMVSALNGTVGLGAAYGKVFSPTLQTDVWKFGLMVTWSFNFNNGPGLSK